MNTDCSLPNADLPIHLYGSDFLHAFPIDNDNDNEMMFNGLINL